MLVCEDRVVFAFGPFTVDVLRRTVTKNGVPLRLTLKCVELLIAFVRNPGKPLTKEELLEAAWPDPQASDATLAQHVFLLRRALRHDGCVWIRTVPNVGYCFSADVTALSRDDERARALSAYLEGARTFRDVGTERALRSAIDLCGRAISLDEANAGAYALRASCWRLLAESMHAEPVPCLQSARADSEAAMARDGANADARLEAALCAALLERDGRTAARHLEAAQRIRPHDAALGRAQVWLALMDGRRDEAVRVARQLGGPLYAAALYMNGEIARAQALLENAAGNDLAVRLMRGACRLLAGDARKAQDDLRFVYYAQGEGGEGGTPSVRQYALALYIFALAKLGDVHAARTRARALHTLAQTRYVSPMARAVAHLALGEHDAAIAFVEEAVRRRDPWSAYVPIDPILGELRAHPRFGDLALPAA